MATEPVFDDDEIVWLFFPWFAVGEVNVDGAFAAAATFVVECNFVVGGITKIADVFLAVVTIHPTAVIGGEMGVDEGFFFCGSRHDVS